MTVYVDDAATAAPRIFQVSRLSAGKLPELHEFAGRLGLDRSSFKMHLASSTQCAGGDACVHWHYQLTDPQRRQAKLLGAKPLDWMTMSALLSALRFEEGLAANRAAGLDRPPGYGPCNAEREGLEQGYKIPQSWMAVCVRCHMITARRDTDGMPWCGGGRLVLVELACGSETSPGSGLDQSEEGGPGRPGR